VFGHLNNFRIHLSTIFQISLRKYSTNYPFWYFIEWRNHFYLLKLVARKSWKSNKNTNRLRRELFLETSSKLNLAFHSASIALVKYSKNRNKNKMQTSILVYWLNNHPDICRANSSSSISHHDNFCLGVINLGS